MPSNRRELLSRLPSHRTARPIAIGAEQRDGFGATRTRARCSAYTQPAGGWGTDAARAWQLSQQADGAAQDRLRARGRREQRRDRGDRRAGRGWQRIDRRVRVHQDHGLGERRTDRRAPGWRGRQQAGSSALAISPDGKTIVAQSLRTPMGAPARHSSGPSESTSWQRRERSERDPDRNDATPALTPSASRSAHLTTTVVVSAPDHAVGGTASIGAIYVYDEPAAGWSGDLTQTQELNPATTTAGETGYSLGFDGGHDRRRRPRASSKAPGCSRRSHPGAAVRPRPRRTRSSRPSAVRRRPAGQLVVLPGNLDQLADGLHAISGPATGPRSPAPPPAPVQGPDRRRGPQDQLHGHGHRTPRAPASPPPVRASTSPSRR